MESTREKMLEALREIHYLAIPGTPSARPRNHPVRPSIEQRPSQERLLPDPNPKSASSGYGSSIPSTHEEESAVDQFLGDSDRASTISNGNSEIAPQTVETIEDPKGTDTEGGKGKGGGGGGKRTRKQKKPLSIA